MTEFLMPSLGADMEAGTLVEWRKKPGDKLESGDIIAEVDTQKGLIEIEVFESGILEDYLIAEGDKVPVGTPMATIKPEGAAVLMAGETPEKQPETHPIQEKKETAESSAPLQAQGGAEAGATQEKPPEETPPEETPPEETPPEERPRIKASPLARSIAQTNQVDLSGIRGTGEGGAITKADVEKALAAKKESAGEPVEQPAEEPQKSPGSAAGLKPPAQEAMRAAVAAAMSLSNREIPQYYLEKRIDMQAAMTWLKETNQQREISERLLPGVLFIKAVAKAIDDNPALNAVWDQGLQIKNEINIGFVVSLRSGGLLVPAIKNADAKTLEEIMAAFNDIIPRARALKLRSSELDSTITITSLGENGADKVFGVIYPPQVAIIGFGSIVTEAVVHNGMLAIRPVVYVTLAGDHRATDGLTGSRFLETLNNHLQNPNAL